MQKRQTVFFYARVTNWYFTACKKGKSQRATSADTALYTRRNALEANRIRIVITLFRLMWRQMEFRLAPDVNFYSTRRPSTSRPKSLPHSVILTHIYAQYRISVCWTMIRFLIHIWYMYTYICIRNHVIFYQKLLLYCAQNTCQNNGVHFSVHMIITNSDTNNTHFYWTSRIEFVSESTRSSKSTTSS